MALEQDKLEAVKRYMRVEGTDDDQVIAALYAAAVVSLDNAGVRQPEAENDLYRLVVWSLTLYYYDHRDDVGSESAFPIGLRPIINQLKALALATEGTNEKPSDG